MLPELPIPQDKALKILPRPNVSLFTFANWQFPPITLNNSVSYNAYFTKELITSDYITAIQQYSMPSLEIISEIEDRMEDLPELATSNLVYAHVASKLIVPSWVLTFWQ